AGGIQPVFWRQWAGHWEFSACFFARDWRGSEPRLRRNDSPVNVHDLPADVRGYYSCADYRSDGGTNEILRNCAVYDLVVLFRLCPDGAHGVGQRRVPECSPGWAIPYPGFCRRHGGPYHVRSVGAGLRTVSGQTGRLPKTANATA